MYAKILRSQEDRKKWTPQKSRAFFFLPFLSPQKRGNKKVIIGFWVLWILKKQQWQHSNEFWTNISTKKISNRNSNSSLNNRYVPTSTFSCFLLISVFLSLHSCVVLLKRNTNERTTIIPALVFCFLFFCLSRSPSLGRGRPRWQMGTKLVWLCYLTLKECYRSWRFHGWKDEEILQYL